MCPGQDMVVAHRWPRQSVVTDLGHGGIPTRCPHIFLDVWAQSCLAACRAGHSMEWLLSCIYWGAQLGAAIPGVGHVPSCWVASAGRGRNKHWVLACERLSAHPAHVCCSRVCPRLLLPGPQMVA